MIRIAGSTISVTPQTRVELGCSNAASESWRGVRDPLEANLLSIRGSSDEHPILLVALDALYVGPDVRRAIVAACDLPEDHVLTFASHTHRAPMLDSGKPRLGRPDPEHLKYVTQTLADAVHQLLHHEGTEGDLHIASGLADHSINRRLRKVVTLSRRPTFGAVVNAPNLDGSRDEEVVTVTFRGSSGKAIAAIWSYACHPVAGPQRNEVSAHYPGLVRSRIRSAEGDPYLPILFLQGFSGDTRPSASATAQSFIRKFQRLLTGPVFDSMNETTYADWASGLADVVINVRASEQAADVRRVGASRISIPSSRLFSSPSGYVDFASLSFDGALTVVGCSAEVVSAYAIPVRRLSRSRTVICAGCMDDVFGYLPTSSMLLEGGYEADGFREEFGIGRLEKELPGVAMDGFTRVIARTELKHV